VTVNLGIGINMQPGYIVAVGQPADAIDEVLRQAGSTRRAPTVIDLEANEP
jgi:hypothetical protein